MLIYQAYYYNLFERDKLKTNHCTVSKNQIQGVPSTGTHFRFQFLTFLIALSKKSNLQFWPKWFNLNFATLTFTKFPKLINFFPCWKNLRKKKRKNCTGPPQPPELHIRVFFRFMYPGTLNFVFSTNLCSRVHDI